jgi:hypothetical protein
MSISIKVLTLGIASTNCYIVGDTETNNAIVIDPVDAAPLLFKTAQDAGWTIKLMVATHGHSIFITTPHSWQALTIRLSSKSSRRSHSRIVS